MATPNSNCCARAETPHERARRPPVRRKKRRRHGRQLTDLDRKVTLLRGWERLPNGVTRSRTHRKWQTVIVLSSGPRLAGFSGGTLRLFTPDEKPVLSIPYRSPSPVPEDFVVKLGMNILSRN